MGRRIQKRNRAVLPVRVIGTDVHGRPFQEIAHTLDFNPGGARLGKIVAQVRPGAELAIQYRNHRGRFIVRWIGPPNTAVEGQIGVEVLEPGRLMWPQVDEPEVAGDEFQPVHHGIADSRRRGDRFPCVGAVEVRASRRQRGFHAKLSDISEEGCHILTNAGLPPGTSLILMLRVGTVEIEASGVVRACAPGEGMGVQFMHFASSSDRGRLTDLISTLRPRPAVS